MLQHPKIFRDFQSCTPLLYLTAIKLRELAVVGCILCTNGCGVTTTFGAWNAPYKKKYFLT
jgi:hypothetical protein